MRFTRDRNSGAGKGMPWWAYVIMVLMAARLLVMSSSSKGSTNIMMSSTEISDMVTTNMNSFASFVTQFSDPAPYEAAPTEQYIQEHTKELLYDQRYPNPARGCDIWKDAKFTTPEIHQQLTFYREELKEYKKALQNYKGPGVEDIRDSLATTGNHDVCSKLEIHPQGLLDGIFKDSRQLSQSAHHHGYVEPLLPPMRHPEHCFHLENRERLMDMGYLVLDFAAICRTLVPSSKIILIDMGASLEFHNKDDLAPAVYLAELYRKFGMSFDHIYAFEITPIPSETVYAKVPEHLMTAFHWINVGVDPSPESKLNPLKSIVKKFKPHDLVVVKLDIDTPAVELKLVQQILNDPELIKLVDHFYFEHHVDLEELRYNWKLKTYGTVEESLHLFQKIRQKGPVTHFWV